MSPSQEISQSGGTPSCGTLNRLCSKGYRLDNLVNNLLVYFMEYRDEHVHITIIL